MQKVQEIMSTFYVSGHFHDKRIPACCVELYVSVQAADQMRCSRVFSKTWAQYSQCPVLDDLEPNDADRSAETCGVQSLWAVHRSQHRTFPDMMGITALGRQRRQQTSVRCCIV